MRTDSECLEILNNHDYYAYHIISLEKIGLTTQSLLPPPYGGVDMSYLQVLIMFTPTSLTSPVGGLRMMPLLVFF